MRSTTATFALRFCGEKRELVLPATKTKMLDGRVVPISSRLWTILEMRRTDPAGRPHPPEAFIFGTEIGTRVTTIKNCLAAGVPAGRDRRAALSRS
jgi:hypothetical protein